MAVNGSLDLPLSGSGSGGGSSAGTVVINGLTVPVKFAFANIAASTTDGSIVAAVTGKRIYVLGVQSIAGATQTNITYNSKGAGAGTAITSLRAYALNGGEARASSPIGYFQTNVGEALTATTGAGSTVGIDVQYAEA